VDVRVLHDPEDFLDEAGRLLLEDEARHNLILGLAGTIQAEPSVYAERQFWIVRAGDTTVAAALRTPPYNLVLARPRNEQALETLVSGIEEELPGVVGVRPEVDAFAQLWSRRHGVTPRVERQLGVYALDQVQRVPRPPGGSRLSSRADVPLLLDWIHDFALEVLHEGDPDRDAPERIVEQRLGSPHAGFLLWECGGDPVSVAGWGGPTPNGIRIGPVYTPPELRARGYATALVADVSVERLAAGRRFCFLFTDLANPTSNAIYERIGYVRVGESAQVAFEPRNSLLLELRTAKRPLRAPFSSL
jgi:predicted GNAT family acetyltransferase